MSESTLAKMPHCLKSHVMAHLLDILIHVCFKIHEESSGLVLNGVILPCCTKYLMTIILWNKYQPTTIISPQEKTLALIMVSLVNSLDNNQHSI